LLLKRSVRRLLRLTDYLLRHERKLIPAVRGKHRFGLGRRRFLDPHWPDWLRLCRSRCGLEPKVLRQVVPAGSIHFSLRHGKALSSAIRPDVRSYASDFCPKRRQRLLLCRSHSVVLFVQPSWGSRAIVCVSPDLPAPPRLTTCLPSFPVS